MDVEEKRPGIYVYYEQALPALKMFDDLQLGALFRAYILYSLGKTYSVPNETVNFALEMMKPSIDACREKYRNTCLKNKYAAQKRHADGRGESMPSYEEWLQKNTPE